MGNPTENELIARQFDTLRGGHEERSLHVIAATYLSHVHALVVEQYEAGYLGDLEQLEKMSPITPSRIRLVDVASSEFAQFVRRFVVSECRYGLFTTAHGKRNELRLHVLAHRAVAKIVNRWPTAPNERYGEIVLDYLNTAKEIQQLELIYEAEPTRRNRRLLDDALGRFEAEKRDARLSYESLAESQSLLESKGYSVAGSMLLGPTDHMSRLEILSAEPQADEMTRRLAREFLDEVRVRFERWLRALATQEAGALTHMPELYVSGVENLEALAKMFSDSSPDGSS